MPEEPLEDVRQAWSVVSSRDLFRAAFPFALRSDRITGPGASGEPFDRVVLEHPGACVILAVDDQERVLCLRQYRHPVGRRLVELPAGLMDVDGEEPEQVARRELAEEAGLAAGEWTHLVSVFSSPGISEELMHLFLARDLSEAADTGFVREHEEADMSVEWVPFAELHAAVLAGRVRDAPLVVAVLVAAAQGHVVSAPGGLA